MNYNFAILIISHERPECSTYSFLREHGYTGKIVILIDDKDACIDEYKEKYKEQVVVFDKDKVELDLMDNFDGPKSIATYAREQCMVVAKEQNLDCFIMIDDDLKNIKLRKGKSVTKKISNLDDIFDNCVDYLMQTKLDVLGFGTDEDYIGGKSDDFKLGIATNIYLIKVNSNIHFRGRYTEDRIMFLEGQQIGKAIMKTTKIHTSFNVWRSDKKTNKGGCQDAYGIDKTYQMYFYPVIATPNISFIRVSDILVNGEQRVTSTTKRHSFPKIISGRYKK